MGGLLLIKFWFCS